MNERTDEASALTVAVFGGQTARGLAVRLSTDRDVRLLSADRSVVERCRSGPVEVRHVEYRTADLSAHVTEVDAAVVAPDRDRTGLLVARKLAATGEIDRVLVRLDAPEHEAAFADLDCDVVDFGAVLHDAVESTLEPTSG